MKKTISTLILSALLAGPAWAATAEPIKTLHVEYSYSGVAAKFKLYQQGVEVCVVPAKASGNSFVCKVTIGNTPQSFALTAIDANGMESPRSAPYLLSPPPEPVITMMSITYTYGQAVPTAAAK